MARVQNTLIGKSSGSVGGATFSSWKGINVLKSKALVVQNPKTIGQRIQRNRMTVMVALYRLIATVIYVGYKSQAVAKSAYNAFVADNIIDATDNPMGDTVNIVYGDLKVSKGTIGVTPLTSVTGTNASPAVALAWDDTLEPVGSADDDEVYAAVYNETQDVWGFSLAATNRSFGTVNVTLPANVVTADVLHAYLFFKSAIADTVSDSAYGTDTP